MTFEQFKKSICDKDPQVKWALDLIDEEVKEALQQQREEMKKEILKIGEHFVKFGEKKGVEAIDMVLAVINPQQNGESKK
jgi:hypothetical protein